MAVATADEDAPPNTVEHADHNENDDNGELQDFRFFAVLKSGSAEQRVIPKRGDKDFEFDGTKHQDTVLAASRQAMHDALDYTRVHLPRTYCRAWYFGEGVVDRNEARSESEDPLSENVRGRGLTGDHVVMVERAKGTHFSTMGKAPIGIKEARIWLLPEEALYLVERGNLDLWWPRKPMRVVRGIIKEYRADAVNEDEEEEEEEEEDGLPLSLHAAYALLIGEDGGTGKVRLDSYNVYANLKRTGYIVSRVSAQDGVSPDDDSQLPCSEGKSLFAWLFGPFFTARPPRHGRYGPLVSPGLYRSYNHIYRQLSVIPRYVPLPRPWELSMQAQYPFRVVYSLWKSSRTTNFAKSNPGMPDFRIAIVSSRSTSVPSLSQLTSMLESTPWDPPKAEWMGPGKSYQRLKHGWRNVVLAVVDQGIMSFVRLGEAAFGEEKLFERFDQSGKISNSKKQKRGAGHDKGKAIAR